MKVILLIFSRIAFNNQVKLNIDTDFKKFKTPIYQNVGINMQSLDKIPAQESFSDRFNKIVKKIPWKDLMIWTAIGGFIYLLWKIPPKNNSRRER